MPTTPPRFGHSLVGALLLAAFASVPVVAQEAYICSIERGAECDEAMECAPPLPNPPRATFLHIDVTGMQITALAPETRRGEVTPVASIARNDGDVILSGTDANKGWSIVIGGESAKMTLTMSEDRTAWMAFGSCMPAEDVRP